MGAVLAIDQGTSGTKSIVVADDDTVLSVCEQAIHPKYGPSSSVEQDPGELWDSVYSTACSAIEQAGVEIDAISLTNQGETVMAWDPQTGDPYTPFVVWQDGRAAEICTHMAAQDPRIVEEIRCKTGLVLDPYFSAPKHAWIRQNLTDNGIVTTSDSWLLHRLTGEFVTDVTTASRSLVFGLEDTTWDPELLAAFGLEHEILPDIVACDSLIGSTSVFGSEIPVAGVIVDQQAALLAQSCIKPGQSKCTFGTGAFLLTNVGTRPQHSPSGLTCSIAWESEGCRQFCFDGQTFTAASAVRWISELGLVGHASELDGIATPDDSGVMCVPAFAGLAAPWWKPKAKAALVGMTLSSTKGDIVAAVLRGLAANISTMIELVQHETGVPMESIQVDGGLTRSRFLMQALADLTGMVVSVFPSAHATPLGAVALARKALHPELSLQDCIVTCTSTSVYEPQWSVDQRKSYMNKWKSLVEDQSTLSEEIQ